jgi:hypothetical protein
MGEKGVGEGVGGREDIEPVAGVFSLAICRAFIYILLACLVGDD